MPAHRRPALPASARAPLLGAALLAATLTCAAPARAQAPLRHMLEATLTWHPATTARGEYSGGARMSNFIGGFYGYALFPRVLWILVGGGYSGVASSTTGQWVFGECCAVDMVSLDAGVELRFSPNSPAGGYVRALAGPSIATGGSLRGEQVPFHLFVQPGLKLGFLRLAGSLSLGPQAGLGVGFSAGLELL